MLALEGLVVSEPKTCFRCGKIIKDERAWMVYKGSKYEYECFDCSPNRPPYQIDPSGSARCAKCGDMVNPCEGLITMKLGEILCQSCNAKHETTSVELEPRLLYGAECEQRHIYTFKINTGLYEKESGQVKITFKDGRFESAAFPFSGNYTRNGWRILAEIEQKITDIENLERKVSVKL